MIYSGENFNIELTDNDEDDLIIARSNGLAIVDTGNCEKILKENNILPPNERLFSLNTNVKNSQNNNMNNTQYTLQSLYTTLVDSRGNNVNASLCSDFIIKLPTGNQLQNQSDYVYMKSNKGVDKYNKSDPFFSDVCTTYSQNNSDIVLESRNELYPKQIECNAGCIYNGIDEHGYSLCKCADPPKEKVFNVGRDLIFKPLNMANHKLVHCIANLFKVELTLVYGLFTVVALTFSYLVAFYIHSKFINVSDLAKNSPKVIMNDLYYMNLIKDVLNPQLVGVPLDEVKHKSNQPIVQQVINNDANLVLENNVRENEVEEGTNNVIRDSIIHSPNKIKVNKDKKKLSIHTQEENNSRMVNNFVIKDNRPGINSNQFEEVELREVNPNTKLNNKGNIIADNVLTPETITKKTRKLTANSILLSSPIQSNTLINHPMLKVIDSTLPRQNKAYTIEELNKAPLFVQFEIDQRSLLT